jgi:hypothetical protein
MNRLERPNDAPLLIQVPPALGAEGMV